MATLHKIHLSLHNLSSFLVLFSCTLNTNVFVFIDLCTQGWAEIPIKEQFS